MNNSIKHLILLFSLYTVSSCEIEISREDFTPINQLNFEKVLSFSPNEIEGISMGITRGNSENAIYISSRDDYPLQTGSNREQILKINLETNEVNELIFDNSDFITKHLFTYKNNLFSFGGQFINKYDLSLNQNISSINHGKLLSQFGLVKNENNLLIIGGDFNESNSNRIYTWNPEFPAAFEEFTTLPSSLYGTAGFITEDNKLLLVGGTTDKLSVQLNDKVYVIDINSPKTINQYDIPEGINITYMKAYQDHLLISGRTYNYDVNGNLTGRYSLIYDFDYQNKKFTKIETNLNNPDGYHVIGQMEIVGNQLYIIYGSYIANDTNDSLDTEWSLYKAHLD